MIKAMSRGLGMLAVLTSGATLLALQGQATAATPKLFVYKGTDTNCDVAPISTPFRNMIGRTEDGQIVFLAQNGSPDDAWNNVDWEMGCYQGLTPNVAVSVPLAYPSPSGGANGVAAGAHTLQDVAAGKLDALYQHMAADIVQRGFRKAYIRLGWEHNGSWYGWAAGPDKTAFNQAFAHVAAIFKAATNSKFTIILNPSTGQDASGEFPASGVDQVGWDVYKNQYNIGSATSEPAQYQSAYSGWWGISSMASWYGQEAHCVPEFGVGGGLGDDGPFMASSLAYFESENASFIGYWDSTASYDGIISDGSKPAEALEYLKVFGPGDVPSIFKNATLYQGSFTASISSGSGMHALLIQLASGSIGMYIWGNSTAEQNVVVSTSWPKTIEKINIQTGLVKSAAIGQTSTTLDYSGAAGPKLLIFQ